MTCPNESAPCYLCNKDHYKKLKWISVKEKLPKFNKNVLAIEIKGKSKLAFYKPKPFLTSLRKFSDEIGAYWETNIGIVYPTHWMSLPEPPKETK
jgi:hypothetical protein